MQLFNTPLPDGAPYGESNREVLYIAVGGAIHAWEEVESALARLFLAFSGTEELPENLAAYGSDNRRFSDRMKATRGAAASYFVKTHDQDFEGLTIKVLREIECLSIERHRIAHGKIAMLAKFDIPDGVGTITVSSTVMYRWGAPFYSVSNLRTSLGGLVAADIDALHDEFGRMFGEVESLTNRIVPWPSR